VKYDIRKHVQSLQRDMLSFARDLVRIRTENPPGNDYEPCVRETYGRRPGFYMCPGLLEIRYYLRHGIPAYAFGPGELACAHGPNEFINIDRMYKCTETYVLTALKLLSPG